MLMLRIDRHNVIPIYRQILEGVVRLVDTGTLAPGDRFPPTRAFARAIGVHRSTILRVYEELAARGYLESRPGSYSTVRSRPRRMTVNQPPASGLIDWDKAATSSARKVEQDTLRLEQALACASDNIVDLSRLKADQELSPSDDLGRCLRSALASESKDLLDYGDPGGYPPLREAIARRMRGHGVDVSAEGIVITGGAQQAIDLVLRVLGRCGDRVLVESPTYMSALRLFRLHGLEILDVPMRSDGMDLDVLERNLARKRPILVYTMPNFQNPTGITTKQAHRERLLDLCETHRVPILEDGFEEEMKYFGKAVLPIKSMDSNGIVIYVGTFSKVVFPGLRVGWIAAPRAAVELVRAAQRACCLAGNSLAQAAMQRFVGSGRYEAHLRRLHKTYRRRMQAMLQGLSKHMPSRGVEWTKPQGGYTLWLRVNGSGLDEGALQARFRSNGVEVLPGSLCFSRPADKPHFRLSIACRTEAEILEGCRRLGASLNAALAA